MKERMVSTDVIIPALIESLYTLKTTMGMDGATTVIACVGTRIEKYMRERDATVQSPLRDGIIEILARRSRDDRE